MSPFVFQIVQIDKQIINTLNSKLYILFTTENAVSVQHIISNKLEPITKDKPTILTALLFEIVSHGVMSHISKYSPKRANKKSDLNAKNVTEKVSFAQVKNIRTEGAKKLTNISSKYRNSVAIIFINKRTNTIICYTPRIIAERQGDSSLVPCLRSPSYCVRRHKTAKTIIEALNSISAIKNITMSVDVIPPLELNAIDRILKKISRQMDMIKHIKHDFFLFKLSSSVPRVI